MPMIAAGGKSVDWLGERAEESAFYNQRASKGEGVRIRMISPWYHRGVTLEYVMCSDKMDSRTLYARPPLAGT